MRKGVDMATDDLEKEVLQTTIMNLQPFPPDVFSVLMGLAMCRRGSAAMIC